MDQKEKGRSGRNVNNALIISVLPTWPENAIFLGNESLARKEAILGKGWKENIFTSLDKLPPDVIIQFTTGAFPVLLRERPQW